MRRTFPAIVSLMASAALVHSPMTPAASLPAAALSAPQAVARPIHPALPAPSALPTERSWGKVFNGLQCSLEVTPAPAIPKGSAASAVDPSTPAFSIHLRNAGQTPIRLLDPPAAEINLWGPQLFKFEFRDAAGQPVTGVTCTSFNNAIVLYGSAETVLAPGKEMAFLARPSTWINGQQFDLDPGDYQVRVTYQAAERPASASLKDVAANCWSGDVESSWAAIHPSTRPAASALRLVWGPVVNGMQAAIELMPDQDEYILGERAGVRLRVRNVGAGPVSFTSETWRQDDSLTVTDERGMPSTISGVWFTGWPLQVRYTVPAGKSVALDTSDLGFARDRAQAKALQGTAGKMLFGSPGRYSLRYMLRLPDLQRITPDGKPVPSSNGEWTGEIDTGIRQLTLLTGPIYPVFGPVVERTLPVPSSGVAAHFNSGVVTEPVVRNRNAAAASGPALSPGPFGRSLVAFHMALAPAGATGWNLSPEKVMDAVTPLKIQRQQRLPLTPGVTKPTFFFKTQDGQAGILQVIGHAGRGQPLKVRYKLVYRDTAWGKAVHDLQGGVRFSEGAHPIHIGDTIDLDYYLRNAGASDLAATYSSPWVLWGGNPPNVSDEEGQTFALTNGATSYLHSRISTITLKPGETYRIGRRPFGVRAQGWKGSEPDATLLANPGTYRLTQPCYLQVAAAGPGAGRSQAAALLSGELELPILPPDSLQSLKTLMAAAPPVIHTGAASWGPVVNGLQAGLSLDFGDRPYAFNENVSFTVHLKNASDHPVKLTLVDPQYLSWTAAVRDGAGNAIPIDVPASNLPVRILHRWLAVGETIDVPSIRLGLRGGPSPAATVDPILHAPAGPYHITYSCHFDADGSDSWTGTLITGAAGLNVVSRQ